MTTHYCTYFFFFIRRRDASVLPRPHRLLTHFDAQRGARGPLRIPTETRAGRPVPPFSDILVVTPRMGFRELSKKWRTWQRFYFERNQSSHRSWKNQTHRTLKFLADRRWQNYDLSCFPHGFISVQGPTGCLVSKRIPRRGPCF